MLKFWKKSNKNLVDKAFASAVGEDPSESDIQQRRIVCAITRTQLPIVDEELYEKVGVYCCDIEGLVVESVSPIPLVSFVDIEILPDVLQFCKQGTHARVVAAIGEVRFGLLSEKSPIMSYGSSGPIVSHVIRGACLLPYAASWIDEQLASLSSISTSKEVMNIDDSCKFAAVTT